MIETIGHASYWRLGMQNGSELSRSRMKRFGGSRALAAVLFAVAGMVGSVSSASAATFYVNDGSDDICSRVSDGGSTNFDPGVVNTNCGVKSVADINDSLFPEGGTGSMVLNSSGLFLNNKMQINGTMSLSGNKLIDLAQGTADTDGVNVGQLRGVMAGLGGGAGIDANGNVVLPTYNIGGQTYNNVDEALKNLDQRVTDNTNAIDSAKKDINSANQNIGNLDQRVTNVENNGASNAGDTSPYVAVNSTSSPASATGQGAAAIGGGSQASGTNSTAIGEGAKATANNAVALGAGSVADQAGTVSVGSAGNERRITNVADGMAPTDAVNMRQFQDGIASVARAAYSGVAAATALTMIPDVDPGKTLAIGIGTANYKGYQAGAIGASARVTPNLKLKVGAGMSAAGTTVGGGASYQW
jgi:autotransporter adhesin